MAHDKTAEITSQTGKQSEGPNGQTTETGEMMRAVGCEDVLNVGCEQGVGPVQS